MNSNQNVQDMTLNHQCSRCGNCCGLFIPFTKKELTEIKKYVKEHNIQPTNRVDIMTGNMEAHCCFYNKEEKKCNIYKVRPFVCRDFKCDHKDWKVRRDSYEKRAYYNSTLTDQTIMGTFDDLVFDDYYYIIRYLLSLIPSTSEGIESEYVIALLKQVNRLDLLKYLDVTDENGKTINGEDLLK